MSSPRGHRLAVIAAVAVSVALRIRFVFAPVGTDEGGYLAIARAWRHGADLYHDVWVDRPQGLLVLFRAYDMVIGPVGLVRVLSLVFGAIAVVAVAWGVRAVAGVPSGTAAALLVAVMSASPAIEGFQANGELLSGAMSAVAVALACGVLTHRLAERWMVAAGVAGALGWSLKQSGIDGLAAVALFLLLAGVLRWDSWLVTGGRLGRLAAGAVGVVGLSALHGALTGWGDWTYAVWGYRLEKRSALEGADWPRLWQTAVDAWPVFLLVVIGLVVVAVVLHRSGTAVIGSRAGVLFVIWPGTALLGFLLGGQFFHHYWVILTFPIGALCGLLVGRLPSRQVRSAVLFVMLMPMLGSFVSIVHLPNRTVNERISGEQRSYRAKAAGEWLAAHRHPGDSLYVLCAAANLYAYAEMDPIYRYLWFDGVQQGRNAQDDLVALLAGDDPPTWVAAVDLVGACTGSAAVADALTTRYHAVETVDGIALLLRNDA
jgi:hypothetical protein